MCAQTWTHIHSRTHHWRYMHVWTHTIARECTCTHGLAGKSMHACTHVQPHAHMLHTHRCAHSVVWGYTWADTYTHACTHIRLHVRTHTHIRLHACTRTCTHSHTRVCLRTCVSVRNRLIIINVMWHLRVEPYNFYK